MNYKPKRRAGSGLAKSLLVFIAAYGLGAIIASFVTPILAPSLTFLAIPVFAGITVLFILINGAITFPVAAVLLKKTHTGSIDT